MEGGGGGGLVRRTLQELWHNSNTGQVAKRKHRGGQWDKAEWNTNDSLFEIQESNFYMCEIKVQT